MNSQKNMKNQKTVFSNTISNLKWILAVNKNLRIIMKANKNKNKIALNKNKKMIILMKNFYRKS